MKSLEARLKAIKASDDQAVLLQALDDRSHLIIEAAARRLAGGAHRASGTHPLRPRRRLADHDDAAVRHAARSFLSPE